MELEFDPCRQPSRRSGLCPSRTWESPLACGGTGTGCAGGRAAPAEPFPRAQLGGRKVLQRAPGKGSVRPRREGARAALPALLSPRMLGLAAPITAPARTSPSSRHLPSGNTTYPTRPGHKLFFKVFLAVPSVCLQTPRSAWEQLGSRRCL